MNEKRKYYQEKAKQQQNIFEISPIVVILFLSFFIFTVTGAGNITIISCIGVLLCMVGVIQSSVKVDLWIFIPLVIYIIISFISGYRIYGSTISGIAATQSVFPIVYLLIAYLSEVERLFLKRLCAFWIGMMACIGIIQFMITVYSNSASRLSGIMGNPNAMGAVMVLGWFALQSCLIDLKNQTSIQKRVLQALEFMVLIALALTLSFGAFGALGLGIIVMHVYGKESFSSFINKVVEVIFACGCGVLLYIAGDLACSFWLCILLTMYIIIASFYRDMMKMYFKDRKWLCCLICFIGVVGASLLLYLRPNAMATCMERFAMIKNGLTYLGENPLLGVGPYQCRLLNLYDSDPYFNTWHIHNVFVHIGVELGYIALAMLIIATLRHFFKKEDPAQRGMFFASFIHNMMDTSFFYIATIPFLMMCCGTDERKLHSLNGMVATCIFCGFAILFVWNMIQCLMR